MSGYHQKQGLTDQYKAKPEENLQTMYIVSKIYNRCNISFLYMF